MTVLPFPAPAKWRRRALIAGGAALSLVAAYVAGRYSAPTKIEERTKVELRTVYQVERVEVATRVEGPVRVVERRVEVPGPAGPTITIERVEDRGPVIVTHDLRLSSSVVADEALEASRSVTRGRSGWRASVSADPLRLSLDARSLRFGVERRLFGPLWLGASYQHGGAAFVSLAAEF